MSTSFPRLFPCFGKVAAGAAGGRVVAGWKSGRNGETVAVVGHTSPAGAVEAESAGVLLFQRVSQKAGDGHVCVALPDQILSFDHPEIIAAYERAKAVGNYESVLAHTGKKVKHYGLTDHKEYFAEGTEAFFYRNDLYPFVRCRAEGAVRGCCFTEPSLDKSRAQ